MKKPGLMVLGGLLSFALIGAGCGSSSSGGSGGSGGGAGKGGSGGGSGGGGGKGGSGGGAGAGGGTGGGAGGATDGSVDHPTDGQPTDGNTDASTTTTLYDFESGAQGWAWGSGVTGATAVQSTDQHFDGANSLKASLATVADGGTAPNNALLTVGNTALWPGTVVTFHAFFPTGTSTSNFYFQAISQSNNYDLFDTNGNGTRSVTPGAFNTWTYTVPNTFPGGLQVLGFQLGDNAGGANIAGMTFYLDAITASGGVQNCATGTGTGSFGFEAGEAGAATLDPNFGVDGYPSTAGVALSASTDQAFAGTGSMKIAITGLGSATGGQLNMRQIFLNKAKIFCGQTFTIHVFMPTGSDGITFQAYAKYNAYAKTVAMGPSTITRNGWNTYQYTVPNDVGPGGLQQIGVQIINGRGTPDGGAGDAGADGGANDFTGNIYVDNLTW
jgi:hypothetical protein